MISDMICPRGLGNLEVRYIGLEGQGGKGCFMANLECFIMKSPPKWAKIKITVIYVVFDKFLERFQLPAS